MSRAPFATIPLCVLVGVLLLASPASGQPRPGAVQPGQVERQFERPPEPTARPGGVDIPAPSQTPPANADTVKFVLKQLTVDGVTVYPEGAFRDAYARLLNTEVSLADIYRVVDVLTARYRNDGYILTQVIVPAQSVDDGAVRLQAVEGYVAEVRVDGGSERLRARVRNYANRFRHVGPLTAATLERYILLLNDIPGVSVRAVLAPSQTPGASDLVLQVSERRLDGSLTSDNRGSRAQGPRRLMGDVDLSSLFGGRSLTEVRGVTTVDHELFFAALSHQQLIGTNGGSVGISGSYVYSRPQELAVIPLDLTTNSETASVTYTYPLIRRRSRNLYLRGAFTFFDSRSDIFGIRDTADRTRAVRAGATFDIADRLAGVTVADVEFSQGIDGLGASANGNSFLSRPLGRSDFRKLTLYAARQQALGGRWSMGFAATAQYAFTDLLAPELFSLGGEQFGRGYDSSELLDDHGAAAKLDLRYAHRWDGRAPTTLMPYAFVDGGRVWARTRLPGIDRSSTASSAGGGIRLSIGHQLSGFIEVAKPLDRIVGQEQSRDPRVYAGISIH